jgi:hypothetical protein
MPKFITIAEVPPYFAEVVLPANVSPNLFAKFVSSMLFLYLVFHYIGSQPLMKLVPNLFTQWSCWSST